MSADNGIYILETKDGFRVIEASAIENLYWNDVLRQETDELNTDSVISYFGKAKVVKTIEEAYLIANNLYECELIVEYGINIIQDWKDKEFPVKDEII